MRRRAIRKPLDDSGPRGGPPGVEWWEKGWEEEEGERERCPMLLGFGDPQDEGKVEAPDVPVS